MNGSLNGRRRVVITGMGAVSPLGNDVETSWRELLAGASGAAEITQFDHRDYKVHFACEVKELDPTNWIDRKDARRMDRFAHLILAAAFQAQEDAGLDIRSEADAIGASIATGIGGIRSFQECYDTLIHRGPDRVNPFAIPAIIPNLGAGWSRSCWERAAPSPRSAPPARRRTWRSATASIRSGSVVRT